MIYYVEDDENIRNLAVYALEQNGLEAQGFPSSRGFFEACRTQMPDAVLLDIMLPEQDGLAILNTLRSQEKTRDLPIMMITARSTEYDVVTGLDSGADDYLSKPFGMMELVSRANALLRRGASNKQENAQQKDELKIGSVVLSPGKHRVTVADQAISLTYKEFELLSFLMANPDLVFTREHLLESIWGWTFEGNTRTVDVHIQTLRQKLGKAAKIIETVRGVGYRACKDSDASKER
ncbi:MAG: response regulator transcription factor [Coriobacteriia bacterium]|nr:response regulator transcription factor [Coriobacteriia bacterium]MDR2714185.1 response regulator transcription factor [Coriobacteriales bacterium]